MKCNNVFQLGLLIDWIEKQHPSGSRIVGGWHDQSDFDYVACRSDVNTYCDSIGLDQAVANMEEYGDGNTFSFKYRRNEGDPWINLIVVKGPIELGAWKFATKKCKALYDRGYLLSKETRVDLFSTLRAVYREKLELCHEQD